MQKDVTSNLGGDEGLWGFNKTKLIKYSRLRLFLAASLSANTKPRQRRGFLLSVHKLNVTAITSPALYSG
jgi:hypothetical protein